MLDSLDTAARRAVSRARWHATRLGHQDVDTLHLLLGVIDHLTEHDDERVAELDLDRLRAQVALRASTAASSNLSGRRGFAAGAVWVFARTATIAASTGDAPASVNQLLQSILDEENPDASAVECVMLAAGGEPSRLREDREAVVLEPRPPRADLELEFHPELSPEQIATAVTAIGDVFRAFGGAGFEVRLDARELEYPEPEVIA